MTPDVAEGFTEDAEVALSQTVPGRTRRSYKYTKASDQAGSHESHRIGTATRPRTGCVCRLQFLWVASVMFLYTSTNM